ncbi:hypothetical protein SNE40_022867 [Patella caerulea]|uniref:Uncharacterized protein n=1 Tax=Patella caerulea TaxID=87958 RepID=A0AAN8IZY5_PATCE
MDVTCSWMKILFFMFLYVTVDAEQVDECVKLTSCSCRNSEGIIDLSPLASTDYTAKFKDVQEEDGSYYFSYNPCYSFSENGCTAVSGCQTDMTNYFSLGTQYSAAFKVDATNGLYIEYDDTTDVKRTLQVYLKCDQGEEGKLDVKGAFPSGSAIYVSRIYHVSSSSF